uniref:Uncharacterized protein n=1 Tax=Chlamydomonas euryale TaxID=1486919 RepID=A0A6U2CDV0_9CHLO
MPPAFTMPTFATCLKYALPLQPALIMSASMSDMSCLNDDRSSGKKPTSKTASGPNASAPATPRCASLSMRTMLPESSPSSACAPPASSCAVHQGRAFQPAALQDGARDDAHDMQTCSSHHPLCLACMDVLTASLHKAGATGSSPPHDHPPGCDGPSRLPARMCIAP